MIVIDQWQAELLAAVIFVGFVLWFLNSKE